MQQKPKYRPYTTAMRSNASAGSWFPSALLLLFIGLKLTGHITWSWWWVLSPFWVTFLFGVFAFILYITLYRKV